MRPPFQLVALGMLPLLGACTILSGGDDSAHNAPAADLDAGAGSVHDSGAQDSGSHPSTGDGGGDAAASPSDGGPSKGGPDGGNGGGAHCAQLESCCETMSSSSGCETVVSEGNDSTCASTLSSYQSGGYCTGGTQCATLSGCCATLPPGPGWADTCNQEVGFGNDPECGSLFGTYQTDGYCNGNPGGLSDHCYALQGCCADLAGTDHTTCNGYVTGNLDGTCQSALLGYQNQGLCF